MTTFIDTNVLIDALNPNAKNHNWAKDQLANADQPLVITDMVFSEFSVSLSSLDETIESVRTLSIEKVPYSVEALFYAGRAFKKYKEDNKGPKLNVLSDFLIGAAAAIDESPLVTSNPKDFRSYFPELQIISPASA